MVAIERRLAVFMRDMAADLAERIKTPGEREYTDLIQLAAAALLGDADALAKLRAYGFRWAKETP